MILSSPPNRAFHRFKALALGAGLAFALAAPIAAQDAPKLDVPYVPTPSSVVQKMLDLAQVSDADYVVDLGSGDGRIAIAAAKRGAKAMGVDLNPVRVEEAQENAKKAGVEDKVAFKQGDLFETDFSDADVLTLYLYNSVNLKLRPVILSKLEPGTRVVSHAFSMGDWEPEVKVKVDGRTVYFWIVPARVEGAWQVRNNGQNFSVAFNQSYQNVSGTATIDGKSVPIQDGKLRGDRISFTIDEGSGEPKTFSGRVEGDSIKPVTSRDGSAAATGWQAIRAS